MTSPSYQRVGMTQFLLAAGFVIWLVFLPGLSSHFAWPLGSRLSSMFIGTSFALRAFEGLLMWRQPDWRRIRWLSWGTMAFLIVIFAATYWHLDLMNWAPLNIATIVWMLAYTLEPLVVPFVEPRGADVDRRLGSGMRDGFLQNLLLVVMGVAAAMAGAMFINPAKFITNYWPWPLSPIDARMAASFFAGIVFWAARMKLADDWAEIRTGVQGLILFFGGHFAVWIFNLATGAFDPARMVSAWVYGAVTGVLAIALVAVYLKYERK